MAAFYTFDAASEKVPPCKKCSGLLHPGENHKCDGFQAKYVEHTPERKERWEAQREEIRETRRAGRGVFCSECGALMEDLEDAQWHFEDHGGRPERNHYAVDGEHDGDLDGYDDEREDDYCEEDDDGCRSKREADSFVRRKLAEYSVGLSSPETQKVTLKELVEDVLLRNKNNGNKTVADDESRWKNHLEPFFGHLRATQVSSDLIDRYINKRKSDQTRSKIAPENGTINRELALLKSAFNHATEQTPPKVRFVPHFNMLEENNVRRGFLQDEQYLRLSRECAGEGVWLAGLFETAYAYSWREDELLALRVGQLDLLGKIIDLGETKNGDQRMIHMTEHVFQCLVRCVAGKKSDDFVFTRDDGTRIKDFRQAWCNACIRAGLGRFQCRDCDSSVPEGRKCTTCNSDKKAKYIGLHFHDLRRTGIRNMSRKGVPEKVGMLISGHKTDSIYRRYNIVDMEVLKTATTKIEEHQRDIVQAENNHRTAIVGTKDGADDKPKPIN